MRLVWGQASQKPYETGIDRGVLYLSDTSGVVWNGLQSIDISFDGGELQAYHFDGLKYHEQVSSKHFKAVVTAYNAPDEFGPCVGEIQAVPGLTLTRQLRSRFGLSYRTLVGDSNYKIHLVYNALASPNNRNYSTINTLDTPSDMSWSIDALPVISDTHRPTAHYILDSTKIDSEIMTVIENILYGADVRCFPLDGNDDLSEFVDGDDTTPPIVDGNDLECLSASSPRLPTPDELINYLSFFNPLDIVPNELTGFASLQLGNGDVSGTSINGVYIGMPGTRLTETVTDGIYSLE